MGKMWGAKRAREKRAAEKVKQQAEERIRAMEMLLDAEFIRSGRYFVKFMGAKQPPNTSTCRVTR